MKKQLIEYIESLTKCSPEELAKIEKYISSIERKAYNNGYDAGERSAIEFPRTN